VVSPRELQIDRFRIFYDVDTRERRVRIVAVGWKRGSALYIQGEKYEL
jgi:mRNA-degrading endonuclease RelE of RelBE toxin-antitoxin system